MRRGGVLLLALACFGGCKGGKTGDQAAAGSGEPVSADKTGDAVTADAQPGTTTGEGGTDTAPPAGNTTGTTTGEADETTETGEPAPDLAALPAAPGEDPLRLLLGEGQPETVYVEAVHEHGRRRIVLYRVDLAARWAASRPDDDTLVEQLDEAMRACEEELNGSSMIECMEEAPGKLGIAPELTLHLAHGGFAWELAELELSKDAVQPPAAGTTTGGEEAAPAVEKRVADLGRVLARKRLLDFGMTVKTGFVDDKLKVYDMDGDKRSEILLVFSVSLPTDDDLSSSEASLGFVLDRADLHVQFATTRVYGYEWSDVSSQSTFIETTWLARDENGDGYKDLAVREKTRKSDDPGEYDEGGSDERSERSTVCLYELAGDRWNCPEWLGTEVVDGGKRVEATTVPLEVAPTPAP